MIEVFFASFLFTKKKTLPFLKHHYNRHSIGDPAS